MTFRQNEKHEFNNYWNLRRLKPITVIYQVHLSCCSIIPTLDHKLSIIYSPWITNSRSFTLYHQLSIMDSWLSTLDHPLLSLGHTPFIIYTQSSTYAHPLSIIHFWSSTLDHPLSNIHSRTSTLDHPLSIIHSRSSTLNHSFTIIHSRSFTLESRSSSWSSTLDHPLDQSLLIIHSQSSTLDHPLLIVHAWSSTFDHPLAIIHSRSSTLDHPLSIILSRSSTLDHPFSIIHSCSSIQLIHSRSSINGHSLSLIHSRSFTLARPFSIIHSRSSALTVIHSRSSNSPAQQKRNNVSFRASTPSNSSPWSAHRHQQTRSKQNIIKVANPRYNSQQRSGDVVVVDRRSYHLCSRCWMLSFLSGLQRHSMHGMHLYGRQHKTPRTGLQLAMAPDPPTHPAPRHHCRAEHNIIGIGCGPSIERAAVADAAAERCCSRWAHLIDYCRCLQRNIYTWP